MDTDPNTLGTTGLGTGTIPAPATLGDTPPAPAPAPAADAPTGDAPAADANTLTFTIPNTETQIAVVLGDIPPNVRMDFLRKAVRDYIVNSVNQVNVRYNKAMEPFVAYDEAMKADPLQTAVKLPTGARPTLDLITPAAEARKRLYEGAVRKQGDGTGKPRETKDPLVKLVTDAVVRELFEKNKATTPGYKWTDAVKEVGGDGVKYLDAKIAEKVAVDPNAAAVLEKFKQDRYIKPAKMMLGQSDTKATKGESIL